MTRARTESAAAALCFAAFLLASCLSAPAAPSEPAAAPAEGSSADPASAEAAPSASESQGKVVSAASSPAESARPDPSWARRSPIAQSLIVASLHEPAARIPTAWAVAKPRREPLPETAAAAPSNESPNAAKAAPAPSGPVSAAVSAPSAPLPAPAVTAPSPPAKSGAAPAAPAPSAPTHAAAGATAVPAGSPAAKAPSAPKAASGAAPAAGAPPPSGSASAPAAGSAPAEKPSSASKPSAALPLAPYSSALAATAQPERPAAASRSVSAQAGMRVEIPFDGTGWTYLGEKEGREGVVYETRRFEDEGLVFVLLASKPGGYTLRFQRQDALRGIAYDELVALEVAPKPAAPVAAPASTPAASAAPASAAAPAAAAKAPSETPESMILGAKDALASGRVQGAVDALDRLLSLYPSGTDEAFYLYAQALELNGPLKDIQRAYALYKKLCSDYPQSLFWDASAERVSYIERRYFDIR